MLTVGLTGGTAAGKSSVARVLSECGARHIDADQVGRALTEGPGPLTERILARFGDRVRAEGGGIHRDRLARIVFGDAGARRDLERLLHPAIRAEIERRLREAESAGFSGIVLVEAALLVEVGRERAYDVLLLVESPASLKIERQVRHAGRTAEDAAARLAAQAPAGRKALSADIVVWNDSDGATLAERCREVWDHLTRLVS
jgi:dephospho-CoA kinase